MLDLTQHHLDFAKANAIQDVHVKSEALKALGQARHKAVDDLSDDFFVRAAKEGWSADLQRQWWAFNRLNVDAEKFIVGACLPDYWHNVICRYSNGPLHELLWQTLTHPAMLMNLDNIYNRKGQLNENLGREWLELYTLGVDGGYKQDDVEAMSRWLTGLGLKPIAPLAGNQTEDERSMVFGDTYFDARKHDFDAPALMGQVMNNRGANGLRQLSNWLASHPATLKHWARGWLIGHAGREPSSLELQAALEVLKESGGRIGALQIWCNTTGRPLQVKANSPVKTPLHWLCEVLHALASGRQLVLPGNATGATWRMAHPLFRRASPNGYPLLGQSWANSGHLLKRLDVAKTLVNWQQGYFGSSIKPAELMRTPVLAKWRENAGPKTDGLLRSDLADNHKLQLLLVSPEVMTHEWEFQA